jgi:hypothetical protein
MICKQICVSYGESISPLFEQSREGWEKIAVGLCVSMFICSCVRLCAFAYVCVCMCACVHVYVCDTQ